MALESVSNVKNVPSHFNGKKGNDGFKPGQIESSFDEGEEEDLEDGEILDDEEEASGVTPSQAATSSTSQPTPNIAGSDVKPEPFKVSSGKQDGAESRVSRRKLEEEDEGRFKRDRHKRHKKRHHEGDEDEARDGNKRAKRNSASMRAERQSEGEAEDDDEEMLFIRGASPTGNQPSPSHSQQDHFQPFGDSGGHYDSLYDSGESDPEQSTPHFRMKNRGIRRKRASSGPRISGRGSNESLRGGGSKKRKEKGRNSRGGGGGGHMESNKKRECMFFAQGKCQRGDDCPYLHTGCPQRKMELCKFYLMDCCAKRDKCLYMHSDFPCKFFHSGMKCFSGERCKFSHEPLTDTSRQILLKHIETAPKEILGEFPRLPRDNSGEVILPDRVMDENGSSHQAPLLTNPQLKKIPSLFEIQVKPPPELSNLMMAPTESSGNRLESEPEEEMEENETRMRRQANRNRPRVNTRPGFYHERVNTSRSDDEDEDDSEDDNFETQLRKCMEAQRQERERKERDEVSAQAREHDTKENFQTQLRTTPAINETKVEKSKEIKMPQVVSVPPLPATSRPSFYKDTLEDTSQAVEEAERQRRQLEQQQDEEEDEDEDEDQLVMATFDEDESDNQDENEPTKSTPLACKPTGLESGGEEDTDENVAIPKHLPKKQRELFLRIQQQHTQRAAAAAAEAAEAAAAKAKAKQDVEDGGHTKDQLGQEELEIPSLEQQMQEGAGLPARDENWYSSDEEAEEEERSLATLLKTLANQFPAPAHTSLIAESTTSAVSTSGAPGSVSSTPAPAMFDNLNLSQINISADISKLLSSIRSKATEDSTVKPVVTRDPRLSRDPRSREDPRSQAGDLSSSVRPEAKAAVNVAPLTDVDLRMLPSSSKDLDLRNSQSAAALPHSSSRLTDIDLRQSCFGDTDLRNVSLLGLPFKPVPLHVPCTEIDASIASHPPVQFKLVPAEIKLPDYSVLKLDFSDPHVRNDPRLKKIVAHMDATISPMSPPPCEAPRADPRSRSASSDPRLATRMANTTAPTMVIPINTLPPQIPAVPSSENQNILGSLMRPQDTLLPQQGGLMPNIASSGMLHSRMGLLDNPMMRSEAPGLLGVSPMHMMMDGNMCMMNEPLMQPRQGLLVPPPGLPMQQEEDFEPHKNYGSGGGGYRGPRRARGNGNWERRGSGRGRGARSGNWDRDQGSSRRNRRDYDRHDRSPSRHDRGYSPPQRHGSRSFSPGRSDSRYNSPGRDESRRRYTPPRDSRDFSPSRGHTRNFSPQPRSGARSFTPPRSDSGSFTPPRRSSGSFTPPRGDSGSFTPPR